jgi:[acyl-carrier-protein] S-malonyltransferase
MKIAMLFPGYGSQFVGMGKELYDESRIMQEYFEEAANCLNINFVKLCFASSDVELGRMENAYPALFLLSTSIAAILKKEGIAPELVVGYNTGELAAIYYAGGLSFPDGLYLLSKYASFYQELLQSISVAAVRVIGVTEQELHGICRTASRSNHELAVAVIDTYNGHIVTGHADAVEEIRSILAQREHVTLEDEDIEMGLHSALMDPVALNMRVYSEKVDFKSLTIPLLSNISVKQIQDSDALKENSLKSIHSAIVWSSTLDQLAAYDLLIEVGPGISLTEELQKLYPDKQCISINKQQDIDKLKAIISLEKPSTEE